MHTPTVVKVMLLAALGGCTAAEALEPMNAARRTQGKPTIVLVHGAFADASGWQSVIAILQQDGYKVAAVQNPLSSIAADVETTKRVIDAQAPRRQAEAMAVVQKPLAAAAFGQTLQAAAWKPFRAGS